MDESEILPEPPSPPTTSAEETVSSSSSGISIAVLGPGLGSDDVVGLRKREQIRNELASDGHHPFFPEDDGLLTPSYPTESLLDQELTVLRSPEVKLVIVLYRPNSVGVGWEIAFINAFPDIKAKTAILYPAEYYTPNDALAANTVRSFRRRLPYTDRHFEVCQLVEECRMWASERESGILSEFVPFRL